MYDRRAHIYYLATPDGLEEQDGVTTICHIIDKSDALVPWACKMMAEKLLTDLQLVTAPDGKLMVRYDGLSELILKSKSAHKDALNKAGAIGTIAHDWIETYISEVISGRVFPLNTGWAVPPPDNEQARNCCAAALAWMTHHNVRWICTERKIYSRSLKYAGTFDGLCYADSCHDTKCCPTPFKDRLSLADWKTSNYLYPEYLLQTAAYVRAYVEEHPAEMIQDRWVIRLGKDDGEFEPWHLEARDYFQDMDAFLACLNLKRSMKVVKDRVKAYEKQLRALIKAEKQEAKAQALTLKCKNADKYKGTRAPVCNGGNPCQSCLARYQEVQDRKRISDLIAKELHDETDYSPGVALSSGCS